MAIRRYTKSTDNAPAWGYTVIDNIQGSGIIKMPIGWTRLPQDGIVTFGQTFNLPSEFVPISGTTLRRLDRAGGSGTQTYDINTDVATPVAATISETVCTSIISSDNNGLIQPSAWYLSSATPGVAASTVEFHSKESTDAATHYAIVHPDFPIMGNLSHFGSGTDVSATYSLPARTRYSFPTAFKFPADPDKPGHPGNYDDVAEMVWLNGTQLVGDTYSMYYHYGGGAYDMFSMPNGTVEIKFVTALTATDVLRVAFFLRWPEPMVNISFENPFVEDESGIGVMIEYWNLPKGDIILSHYLS